MSDAFQPRLIASDMDGTLLDSHSAITKRTKRAIVAATDSGIEFLAATGRSHRTAGPLLSPIPAIRWALCSNGAVLYDLHEERVVSMLLLPNDLDDTLERLQADLPDVGFGWETPDGLFCDAQMTAIMTQRYGSDPWARPAEPPLGEVSDRLIKILVGHPTLEPSELTIVLGDRFGEQLEVSSSGAHFAEMTADGAEKGTALARLCAEIDVAQSTTVAFGDQLNDLGMLRWVERGYAMENADPEVKAVTPWRAPSHANNGVAQVVESLLA